MSIEFRAEPNGKVEVDRKHYYNRRCRCMSCLEFFLAVEAGEIHVVSNDGNTKLIYPKKTATIWEPAK